MNPVIGIVVCGQKDDRQYVTQTYIDAVEASGGLPLLIPCCSITDPYLQLCDGFLFCGGDDVTPLLFGEELNTDKGSTDLRIDQFHLSLMKQVLSSRLPVLAICRGMQILNLALGGTIYQDISLRLDTSSNHMQLSQCRSDPCHKIIISPNSMLSKIFGKHTVVNSFHHQCIHLLGKHLRVTAIAADGVIEAIESLHHPFVIGVQWHPECMSQSDPAMAELFSVFTKYSIDSKNLPYIPILDGQNKSEPMKPRE